VSSPVSLSILAIAMSKRKTAWRQEVREQDSKGSLMDQEESKTASSSGSRQPRTLKRQSTDKVVDRAIHDNFRGWNQVDVDGTKVEGMTLREKMTSDRRAQRDDPSMSTGGPYYKNLKNLYMSSQDPSKQLQVTDNNEEVDGKLVKALTAAKATNANRGPLVEWLQTSQACNQKEYVGLLRAALELRPAISASQCTLLMEIVKYVARCRMDDKFRKETDLARPHFDLGFSQVFVNMKKERLSTRTFWDLYRESARLVLPVADVEVLLNAKGEWSDVSEHLDRVVAASPLGRKLFGFAYDSILAEKVAKVIQGHLAALDRHKVDGPAVEASTVAIKTGIAAIHNVSMLPERRVISLGYRGVQLKVEVSTVHDEVKYRLMAYLKGRAVQGDQLVPLFCENVLVGTVVANPHEFDKLLVKEAEVARKVANDMVQGDVQSCGNFLREMLLQKQVLLMSMDPTFNIEIAFFIAMSGTGGEQRLEQEVLLCLPSLANPFTVTTSVQKLTSLADGQLYRFTSRSAQGAFGVVRELMAAMEAGRSPNVGACQGTPFLRQVAQLLPYFCKETVAAGSADAAKVLWGADAISHKFTVVSALVAGDGKYDFDTLAPFHIFSWLMTSGQLEKVNVWTSSLLNSLEGGSAQPLPADKKHESVETGKVKAKKKQKQAEKAGVMNLFA
jgi:hypothetical protein